MAASPEGNPLAFGFIVPQSKVEGSAPFSKNLVSIHDAALKEEWACPPMADAPKIPPLPDPVADFKEFAEEFGLKTEPPIPCRVAASVSATSRAVRVAVAEYGGWISGRKGPVSGKWNPPYMAIPFVPRQKGTLRIVEAPGKTVVAEPFPSEGLFEVRTDPEGRRIWAIPASWFARGMAGAVWLPADPDARRIHVYDVSAGRWEPALEFPDAVADVALNWVSCWDGNLYRIKDGKLAARVEVGGPARLKAARDGSFVVAGTDAGEVIRVDGDKVAWRTKLAATEPKPFDPMKPVIEGVPVWPVGRVGPEHAYVGDIWLVKTGEGAFLVDAGGTSAVPSTLQKIRAAGVDPTKIRHLLHSHSHGDHVGGGYLWRTMGLKVVAPETAALGLTWLMPTVTDYGVWVPRPVDVPLPLKRVGDEAKFTVEGLEIRAIFVPVHSYDLVIYLFELGGKRIAFTGDLGFKGQDIMHRCWGDADKARALVPVIRDKLLAWHPDIVFTGHGVRPNGTEFIESLLRHTEESLKAYNLSEKPKPRP